MAVCDARTSASGHVLIVHSRVGAALGAGQALGARLAARASLLAVPAVWVLVAALLLEPNSQGFILWLFTKVDRSRMHRPVLPTAAGA